LSDLILLEFKFSFVFGFSIEFKGLAICELDGFILDLAKEFLVREALLQFPTVLSNSQIDTTLICVLSVLLLYLLSIYLFLLELLLYQERVP